MAEQKITVKQYIDALPEMVQSLDAVRAGNASHKPLEVTLEEMMHKLIKEPFLPVVKRQEFMGIVVRQEILKAFSAFAHDFTKYYEITKRD